MASFSVIEHVSVYHGVISKATTERILGAVGEMGAIYSETVRVRPIPTAYVFCE
jgi:hypothetical protein